MKAFIDGDEFKLISHLNSLLMFNQLGFYINYYVMGCPASG